ncbi:MAG: ABC transporter ATP-binding protein [bacterium]
MPLIEVQNLSFTYNGHDVLRQVSFSLEKSRFLGILGPNGSGKSTLLKNISGILPPRSGRVLLKNRPISDYTVKERARTASFLPSETFIPYDFTVLDIVMMGRSPLIKWWQDYAQADKKASLEALELAGVGGLERRSINSLSSGERQRVFLAQALAQEPEILLLDEPTSHLDISHQVDIFALLAKLTAEKGLAVIAVSHDITLTSQYCEKILLLKEGAVSAFGTPAETITAANIKKVYGVDAEISLYSTTGLPEIRILRKS